MQSWSFAQSKCFLFGRFVLEIICTYSIKWRCLTSQNTGHFDHALYSSVACICICMGRYCKQVFATSCREPANFKELLAALQAQSGFRMAVTFEDWGDSSFPRTPVTVWRTRILYDALREARKSSFDPTKLLNVSNWSTVACLCLRDVLLHNNYFHHAGPFCNWGGHRHWWAHKGILEALHFGCCQPVLRGGGRKELVHQECACITSMYDIVLLCYHLTCGPVFNVLLLVGAH